MSKKNIYYIAKLAVYTILAILVLVLTDNLLEHLRPFIGGLMILYGVEEMLHGFLFHRHHFFHEGKIYLGLIELIFGAILIASDLKFEYVCIIWATWSIVRESYEFEEIAVDIKTLIPKIVSCSESIVVIVLSVLLILEPGHHHALTHMYLLVVELILSPLIILMDELLLNYLKKRKEKPNQ